MRVGESSAPPFLPSRPLLVAIVFSLVSGAAFGGQDGTMSGRVRDAAGSGLPGVTISVAGPVLQGARTANTRADGSFVVPNLPPGGGYQATFALSGFKTVERPNLSVALGGDTQVNVTLELSSASAEVVVTAEVPVVDVTQTNTSANFDADFLRRVVGGGARNYLSVIGQAPGTVGTGNTQSMGSNSQQNLFTIDGVNSTDPVTHTFGVNLNYDAIQEVSLQTSSFEAQYGRATGAIVNVVTKSGGNVFSGSADFRYAGEKFAENGDHFDRDAAPTKADQITATLGGPLWKDRLWFFGNYDRPHTVATPQTGNAAVLAENPTAVPRDFSGQNYGVKLTFTATPTINGSVTWLDNPAEITGAEFTPLTRAEAAATQKQGGPLYQGKVNAVVGGSWLFEVQGGHAEGSIETRPSNGDLSLSRWTDRFTGVNFDSYNNYQKSDRPRDQYGVSATWFGSGAFGNHQVKAGLDGDRTGITSVNVTTGTPTDPTFCEVAPCGATFTFSGFDAQGNRIPRNQTVSENLPESTTHARSFAAYVQDQWRVIPRLTLNLGLRYDNGVYENSAGEKVLDFKRWQPRLAASFDVTGDGKTVARAAYGIFHDEPGLTISRILAPAGRFPRLAIYRFNPATSRWGLLFEQGGFNLPSGVTDGEIKPTWEEQVNVAIQREILPKTSVSLTYVYKKLHDLYEDSCVNESCDYFVLTNQPGRWAGVKDALRRDYYGYMLEASRRFDRGFVQASWTYSKTRGTIDSSAGQYASGEFDVYPVNFVNTYGFLPYDTRHVVKVYGSYRIPGIETQLGVSWVYRTGFAYDVTGTDADTGSTYFAEPRGSRRTDPRHTLNASLEKEIAIPVLNGLRFSVVGTVYNVLDRESALTFGHDVDSPNTLGQPLTFQQPRNYELGLRLQF